jgi:hypothetical protein
MITLKTLRTLSVVSFIGLAFFSCKKNSTLTPASATAPVSFSVKASAGATSLASQVDSATVNYSTLSSIITTLDVYVYLYQGGVSFGSPVVIKQTSTSANVFGLITPYLIKGQSYLLVFVGVNAAAGTPPYAYKGSFLPTGDTFLVSYSSVNPPADLFSAVVHYTPSSNAAAPPQQVVLQRSVSKVTVTLTDNLSPGSQFPMQLTLFNGANSADLISGAGTLSTTTTSQVLNLTVKGTQNTFSAFFWPAFSQPKLAKPLSVYLTIHAGLVGNTFFSTKTLTLPGNQLLPNTEYKFSGSVLTASQPNSFVTGADTTWNTQQGTFLKRIIKF